jgi:hypothetical protein
VGLCTVTPLISQQNACAKKAFLYDNLQKLLEKYPYLESIQQNSIQHQNSFLSYDSAYTLLNFATIVYICHSLYYEYATYCFALKNQRDSGSFIEKFIRYHLQLLFPGVSITVGIHITFFIRSLSVIILATLYKTIVKLVLMAWRGDLFDFLGSLIDRTVSLARIKRSFEIYSQFGKNRLH